MRSLEILLEVGNLEFSEMEKMEMAERKNNWYVDYISKLNDSELLSGAKEYLIQLREKGIKIALGSASKNAQMILENLNILHLFDAIVDGNKVAKAKPDPEVFILGATELGLEPTDCIVFEDAAAGVEAAKSAGMKVVGIGSRETLGDADWVVEGLYESFFIK